MYRQYCLLPAPKHIEKVIFPISRVLSTRFPYYISLSLTYTSVEPRTCVMLFMQLCILVPTSRAPFGQHQESRPLALTSGLVQRHSVFEWLCNHNRLRPQPIRFFRRDSEHAQSDGKSVNRGLPVLDQARGSTAVK